MSDCIGFTAYNKLSEECQKCSSKNECEKKIKELVGCFTNFEYSMECSLQPILQPILQPMLYDKSQQKRDQLRRDIQKEIMKGGQE